MSKKFYKHLSEYDRKIIQFGIENNSTKSAIAKTLGKDPSTIAKEIKLHRITKQPRSFSINKNSVYIDKCNTRDRSPSACNGCSKYKKRYFYDAKKAHSDYLYTLNDSRTGINMTTSEVNRVGHIIAPLIKQGQSINHILINHPEIYLISLSIITLIKVSFLPLVLSTFL